MNVTRATRPARVPTTRQPSEARSTQTPKASQASRPFAPKSPDQLNFERVVREGQTMPTSLKGAASPTARELGKAIAAHVAAGKTSGPSFEALVAKLRAASPVDYFKAAESTLGKLDMFATFVNGGPLQAVSIEQGNALASSLGLPRSNRDSPDTRVRQALGLWGE